jgi:hypothetical protein
MSKRTRLKKLEQVAKEKHDALWNDFIDKLFSYLPDPALSFLSSDVRAEVAEAFNKLAPEEQTAVLAEQEAENDRIFTLVGLEKTVWQTWSRALGEKEAEIYQGGADIALAYTPESLPVPPGDPTEALERVKEFDFPPNHIGSTRWRFLWELAVAKGRFDLATPLT